MPHDEGSQRVAAPPRAASFGVELVTAQDTISAIGITLLWDWSAMTTTTTTDDEEEWWVSISGHHRHHC